MLFLSQALFYKGRNSRRMGVKLISAAQTGYYYATTKSPQKKEFRMALRKYDPIVCQHVMFYEARLPADWRKTQRSPRSRKYAHFTGDSNRDMVRRYEKDIAKLGGKFNPGGGTI